VNAIAALDHEIQRHEEIVAKLRAARDALIPTNPSATPTTKASRPAKAIKRTKKRRSAKTNAGRFRDSLTHDELSHEGALASCTHEDAGPACRLPLHAVHCGLCGDFARHRCSAHGGRRAAAIAVTGHCRREHAETPARPTSS
jgi:hypothetical protein